MADIQTFKNLQDRVLRKLDEANDTSTTLALVKDALTEANRYRATQEKWPFMLWDTVETITTTINVEGYALHSEYYRPFYFYNRNLADFMQQVDEGNLESIHPDWINDQDSAKRFSLWGRTEVQQQPAAASALTVASSSGTDTAVTVTVRGIVSGSNTTETITVGTTGVKLFTKVLKVTKNGTWVGTMTLSAGATTLLTLLAEEFGRSYQQFSLMAMPSSSEVIEYRFYRQPTVMSADNDRPDIPTPFEDLLVYDALLFFATYNQYDPMVVKLWQLRQQELFSALGQAYSDDRAIGAGADYTTCIPR